MTKLSVNINKIATLRNARGGNVPDLLTVAKDIQVFGAHGITVHPRPDERHVRYDDVRALKPLVHTEFNVEGYPSQSFLDLVLGVRPDQVTLVPDPPGALTSNAGWDVVRHALFLRETVQTVVSAGMRVSLFMEPDASLMSAAAETGTQRIELYTEVYARGYAVDRAAAIAPFVAAARAATSAGLGVNAGHDLNLTNLHFFCQQVPGVLEVSIGHALISDALYFGLENTVKKYLEQLSPSMRG